MRVTVLGGEITVQESRWHRSIRVEREAPPLVQITAAPRPQ